MARKLPPFAAVKAFEATARHMNVSKAAEEMCLSPSAVSHQIRALEEYLDTALFERRGNKLALTLTGRAYSGKLTTLLDAFDDSTRAIREAGSRPLRVLSTPGFAARWLVPRLGRLEFGSRVQLRVSEGAPCTDFSSNDSDVVIQWCDDPVPGVVTEPLMASGRFPVASPEMRRRERIEHPADLARVTLMHDETMDAWGDWFDAAGVAPPVFPCGPTFPNCELSTTAAEAGQGVALAYDAMVRGTLASGRLVRLFDTDILPIVIYSVAYPAARRDDKMIQAFAAWLHDEATKDGVAARPAQLSRIAEPTR